MSPTIGLQQFLYVNLMPAAKHSGHCESIGERTTHKTNIFLFLCLLCSGCRDRRNRYPLGRARPLGVATVFKATPLLCALRKMAVGHNSLGQSAAASKSDVVFSTTQLLFVRVP